MTNYQDITRQIGDQWVAALKRAEDAVATLAQNVQDGLAKVEIPQIPVPEQVTKFNEAVAEQLPDAGEILAANFELTERLLAAQKELALKVLAVATAGDKAAEAPVAEAPVAAKPAAKSAAK